MRRPWRRRGFGGGGAFRSRALISEAACCCKAAAVGGSAVQCGVADEFLIGGGSNTQTGLVGVALGASALGLAAFDVVATGLPPEKKPKLCDAAYETELQNVAANYVAMVPNGQIFDSSLEKGQPYIFRVGSGQVVLDVYPCRRGLTTNQRLSSAKDLLLLELSQM